MLRKPTKKAVADKDPTAKPKKKKKKNLAEKVDEPVDELEVAPAAAKKNKKNKNKTEDVETVYETPVPTAQTGATKPAKAAPEASHTPSSSRKAPAKAPKAREGGEQQHVHKSASTPAEAGAIPTSAAADPLVVAAAASKTAAASKAAAAKAAAAKAAATAAVARAAAAKAAAAAAIAATEADYLPEPDTDTISRTDTTSKPAAAASKPDTPSKPAPLSKPAPSPPSKPAPSPAAPSKPDAELQPYATGAVVPALVHEGSDAVDEDGVVIDATKATREELRLAFFAATKRRGKLPSQIRQPTAPFFLQAGQAIPDQAAYPHSSLSPAASPDRRHSRIECCKSQKRIRA